MVSMPPFLMKKGPATPVSSDENDGPKADPRLSRLAKMQSQYVTEESLAAATPAPPPKPDPDSELDDDEEYLDEEYHDEDEEYEDEEYSEDDYHDDLEGEPDEEAAEPAETAAEEVPIPSEPEEPEEPESDHRIARLRKLKNQFVTEKDLESTPAATEPSILLTTPVRQAIVVCPNCQAEEPRDQKICSACGAKLPNISAVSEETFNPGSMDTALKKYVAAVEKLRSAQMSVQEFLDFLHERLELSRSLIDNVLEVLEESVASEWLPEASGLIREATDLLEESIEVMLVRTEERLAEVEELHALEDEGHELDAPPPDPETAVRSMDFTPDLANLKRANDQLLESLRRIDSFQKQAQEDLEVSL